MTSTNNILVTGGTGFVGSWIIKTWKDAALVCLSSYAYDDPKGWDHPYRYIVHLAPVSPYPAIECARNNNARLLYVSSGAVYHPEYQDLIYRQSKLKWEQECLDSGVDVVIARLFTFMDSSPMWCAFFEAARVGKPLEVWGKCTRSFMHGAELGRWLQAILLHGENGCAYDVGSDRAITNIQLATRISNFTGCPIKYVDRDVPMPVYLPPDTARTRELL